VLVWRVIVRVVARWVTSLDAMMRRKVVVVVVDDDDDAMAMTVTAMPMTMPMPPPTTSPMVTFVLVLVVAEAEAALVEAALDEMKAKSESTFSWWSSSGSGWVLLFA
jgi:nucleotide-binding universal stress UspA family protein